MGKTTVEFRVAEMKKKLKDCQDIRTRSYQHQWDYIEGDKVWYQYKDTSAWHGPASVICQRGISVYVHANGEEEERRRRKKKKEEEEERRKKKKEEEEERRRRKKKKEERRRKKKKEEE